MKPWGGVFKIKKKSRLVERRGMRRSTVAHFACKVRGTNVERASAVDSSQFYKSESWPPTSPHIRGPHFASKVSYNEALW